MALPTRYNSFELVGVVPIMNKVASDRHSSPGRMTRQRTLILEQFSMPGRHLTADMVYDNVRSQMPSISMGTVYRNLDVLSRTGQIRKLDLGGTQSSYDGGMHCHYHVRCVQCGTLSDVSAEPFGDLNTSAEQSTDYAIIGHELEFHGKCPSCQQNDGDLEANDG